MNEKEKTQVAEKSYPFNLIGMHVEKVAASCEYCPYEKSSCKKVTLDDGTDLCLV